MADTQTATILVTDLVGSTELRVRLGEERAEELRRLHDDLLRAAVEAQHGTCVKGLGDGVLALFESASDAVSAAVAIQQAADLHTRDHPDCPLELRVGVSAGDVTMEGGDCFGTPVVEASRLCAAATGGQILAAELVRLLARGRGGHTFIAAGERELKGLPDAVPVVVVSWEPAPRAEAVLDFPPLLAAPPGQLPFAGRVDPFDTLLQRYKDVAGGARRAVLLAGEPGIGKTRLASEAARAAYEQGAVVLMGRCDEGMGVPYQPFVEALAHMVDADPAAERLGRHPGELARLVPDVLDVVPGAAPPMQSDPETERYRLFDAVASWLAAAGDRVGVVLVLDDLHWAERETLLLLRHLIRSPEASGLLILGTYRDTDLSRTHPLAEMLADLRREPVVERLSLSGLDVTGIAELLSAAAGGRTDIRVADLAQALWAETEGNPFFVVEIVRSLVESGVVVQRDGVWTSDLEVEDLPIPEGVREVVGRRLNRLSESTNQVLASAAVVGVDFDVDLLVAVSGAGENAVLDALDEASAAALVRETQPDTYQFTHALVRSTLYDELSATRRGRRHRQVAEALESRGSEAAILAYHYGRSGTGDVRALDYSVAAGEQALDALAPAQALGYFEQALELVDELEADDVRRARALVGLGTAQRLRGIGAYRDTLLEAGRAARRAGDSQLLAAAALANNRGSYSAVGAYDAEKVEMVNAALESIGDDDEDTRARLLATLGMECYWGPNSHRRSEFTGEAVAIARRLGDPATLAVTMRAHGMALLAPDNHDLTREVLDEAVTFSRQIGDPYLLGTSMIWRCVRDMEGANLDTVDEALAEAAAIAEDTGSPMLRWYIGAFRCSRAQFFGDGREVERLALEAFAFGQEAGEPDAANWFAGQYAAALMIQGREAELIDVARTETAALDLPGWKLVLAHLLARTGEHQEARSILREFSADRFADLPQDFVWLTGMAWAAMAAGRVEDVDSAEVIYDLMRPYAGYLACVGIVVLGSVDHCLGILASTLGRRAEAEAHFDAAEAIHTRVQAPGWLAATQLERARMFLRAGETGRARELLVAARDGASAAGSEGVAAEAVALLG